MNEDYLTLIEIQCMMMTHVRSTQEMTNLTDCDQSTKVKKLGVRVPHVSRENNKNKRVNICYRLARQ